MKRRQLQNMSSTSSFESMLLQAFDDLYLDSVSNDWTNQVWENDFCESHEMPDYIEEKIKENDCFRASLTKALKACRKYRDWYNSSDRSVSENSEKGNSSSRSKFKIDRKSVV